MAKIFADSHNFGKSVFFEEGYIYKPRPVGLEWLLLSVESPLRKLLSEANIFAEKCLLNINYDNQDFRPSLKERRVEYIEKPFVRNSLSDQEYLHIGSVIALAQWFGLSDLHHENMFIGHQTDGNFICSPIDIECIFEHHNLPSQSLLVPSYLIEKDQSGLKDIFNHVCEGSHIACLISGYVDTFVKLNAISKDIYELILNLSDIRSFSSRVIIRSTQKYYDLKEGLESFDLFDEERKQITNGDIPYFFKFLESKDIYYWDTPETFSRASFSLSDFENLEMQIIIFDETFFSSRKKDEQLSLGITQIAKYFDLNTASNYQASFDSTEISYLDNEFRVRALDKKLKGLRC